MPPLPQKHSWFRLGHLQCRKNHESSGFVVQKDSVHPSCLYPSLHVLKTTVVDGSGKKFFNRVILLFLLLYFFLHTCCAHHTFFCQNEQSLLTYDGAKGIGNPFKELKTSSSSAGRNKMRRQLQSWVMYSKISVGAFKILRWTRRLWSPFRFVNVVGCQLECWAGKRFRYLYSSVHDEKNETIIRTPNPSISR